MFGKIIEVVLYVKDMQAMVEFYRDVIGLEVKHPQVDDYSHESWVTLSTGECTLSLHNGGEGSKVENCPVFTFSTKDIHRAKSHLAEKGRATSAIVEIAPGVYVFHCWDIEENHFAVKQISNQVSE